MTVFDMLRQAGIVSILSLVLGLAPLAMAAAYFARPTERRLALMRPLSLAGLFASLTGGSVGFLHTLRTYSVATEIPETLMRRTALGGAESLVPVSVGLASLTAAWLLVAAGMSRSRGEP